jgi:hypothetical protein
MRSLVDRKIGPHAVPNAVVEIQSGLPKRNSRQSVDLRAGRSLGKYGARDRNMALENPREPIAHQARGAAHDDRAGDVRRSVFILCAAVDQKDSPLDPPV